MVFFVYFAAAKFVTLKEAQTVSVFSNQDGDILSHISYESILPAGLASRAFSNYHWLAFFVFYFKFFFLYC